VVQSRQRRALSIGAALVHPARGYSMRRGLLAAIVALGGFAAWGTPVSAQQSPARSTTRADTARRTRAAADGAVAPNAAAPAVVADTALIPSLDVGRAADAEIRIALFDLLKQQPTAALARLRTMGAVPLAMPSGGAWRGETDRRFLLAQCFYRLGMDDSLRVAGDAVLAAPDGGRFASVVRSQLLVSAYRTGDLARAQAIARDAMRDPVSPLTAHGGGRAGSQRRGIRKRGRHGGARGSAKRVRCRGPHRSRVGTRPRRPAREGRGRVSGIGQPVFTAAESGREPPHGGAVTAGAGAGGRS
jgi:hypothetical protein